MIDPANVKLADRVDCPPTYTGPCECPGCSRTVTRASCPNDTYALVEPDGFALQLNADPRQGIRRTWLDRISTVRLHECRVSADG
jgi:hypothetical protein